MGSKSRGPHTRESEERLLDRVNLNAAGIDVGSTAHWVAVPEDRDERPVRDFGTHTSDLHRLADWLAKCSIDTVAMESTGVYWIPLYEILQERGFEVVLANARQVKNVPGRKSDISDCQWVQVLHTYGLLSGSFRPTDEILALRSLMRHREKLVQESAAYLQRMQKAMVLMNVQLHTVLSDIAGKTGMAIIRDIAAGQTDPELLSKHRDGRCHSTEDEIKAALTGHYRPEQVFLLRQALQIHDFLQEKIADCDREIEHIIATLEAKCDEPDELLPPPRNTKRSKNELGFDVRSPLYRITAGVDLTQVPGINSLSALRLISEIGTDMSRWPTEKHFTSWLTLAPQNKVSGGKRLGSTTQPSANRAAQVLRMAAMANSRSDNSLAAYYRRLAVRVGKAKAITATARKLAIIIYGMLKHGWPYRPHTATRYNREQRKRRIRRLRKQAEELGYTLILDNGSSPQPASVS